MGQKVHPHGMRVGVIKDWDSKWFADKKDFGRLVVEDYDVRAFVRKNLPEAEISEIDVERTMGRLKVTVHTGKPGMVIGKGGTGVEALKKKLEKLTRKSVVLDVEEIRNPDLDGQLE